MGIISYTVKPLKKQQLTMADLIDDPFQLNDAHLGQSCLEKFNNRLKTNALLYQLLVVA